MPALPDKLRLQLIAVVTGGALAMTPVTVKWFEGVRHTPYKDPVGILTVCYGHTGPDIIPGKYYSDAECEALLNQDLKPVFATIDRQVKVPLNEYRKTALATFIYNVGPTAFGKSTMLKKLNQGDAWGACDEMRRWTFAGGVQWKGLITRREAERALCRMESDDDLVIY
ncbi:lysozyme [Serratia marcescens]|nr:lysozyme [Serratia marcescens]